jgi:hypothetical protein
VNIPLNAELIGCAKGPSGSPTNTIAPVINGTADCVVDVDPLGTEKLDTYPKVSHSDFVTDAVTQAY